MNNKCFAKLLFILIAAMILGGLSPTSANTSYPILMLDISNTNVDTQTEEGFTSFTLADNGSEIDGITIELAGSLDARWRATPTDIPYELIYRDFIFARPDGMTVTLSGLEANQTYDITIYAYDTGSAGDRIADWTANGEFLLTAGFNGGVAPTDADDNASTGTTQSDGAGTIILECGPNPDTIEESGANNPYAFLNALVVSSMTPITTSRRPVPEDGALINSNKVDLQWQPGMISLSSNIYIGEDFDAVSNATPSDTDIFRGNTTEIIFPVGSAGTPYPSGLSEKTTYYWRIDEVNDLHPDSPWKGKVWSFTVASKSAFNPNPVDGALFVDPNFDDPNVTLSWTPGSGSVMHRMYFGDNLQDVQAGSGGTAKGPVSNNYSPGILEYEKTYYWRVDEFDGRETHTGDIWSFTTTLNGLGTVVIDMWENITGSTLDLLRNAPSYPDNPSWSDELTEFSTDDSIGDNYGARIHGWLYVPMTGNYTFLFSSADEGELWLSTDDDPANVQLLASEPVWGSYDTFSRISDPVPLIGGERYYIMAIWKEGSDWDHCQVAWKGSGIPVQQIIRGSYLSPYEPVMAFRPIPAEDANNVKRTPILSWKSGKRASLHHVYFGMDEEAVRNADTGSLEYKGTQELGSESYDPGILELETSYYWRIDEVNNLDADSPWVGEVWSFTVGDYLIVDDFEAYNADDNQIWWAWKDGLGYVAHGNEPDYPGNGTGSAIGDDTTDSFTEEIIIHGGGQSMPFWYDNNKQGFAYYSEADMQLSSGNDWTREGVKELSLWFRGYSATVGSFTEAPTGTYTITASGEDIADQSDEFHFAYKMMSGPGSIVARVLSIADTNEPWARAGVMIRETLDPGSKHAFASVTVDSGVAFQGRITTDGDSFSTNEGGINAPHWVKLERDMGGNFIVSRSTDGTNWEAVAGAPTQGIQMAANVYVGLAVTSSNATGACEAQFSNVTISGNITQQQWMNQDIGITSNEAESMYVVLNGDAVIYHDDPEASLINAWTEWRIDLQAFADLNVDLTHVDSIAVGIGSQGNITTSGGIGKIYIDDIRLYRPGDTPEE